MTPRRARAVAVAAAVAVPAVVLVATPAAAERVGTGYCRSNNRICMWEDPGGQGSVYANRSGAAGRFELGGWDGDNEVSSVTNWTDKCVTLYSHDAQAGRSFTIGPKRENMKLADSGFDNDAESYMLWSC